MSDWNAAIEAAIDAVKKAHGTVTRSEYVMEGARVYGLRAVEFISRLKRPASLDGECEKNPDHFPRGTRVRMSRLGKDRFSKCADRIGTIVSYYPREQLVSIRWDGYKTVNRMHIDFLEPLPAAPASPEKAETKGISRG